MNYEFTLVHNTGSSGVFDHRNHVAWKNFVQEHVLTGNRPMFLMSLEERQKTLNQANDLLQSEWHGRILGVDDNDHPTVADFIHEHWVKFETEAAATLFILRWS